MAATSALLKSASSIRDQLATYQDSVKAFEYSNSAYTDSALADYQTYLQNRIDALSKSGSISDASKALSLTKSLDGATKSNSTATIQRENINMMAGNASLTDKYNVVVGQYSRAVANGDLTLAQSLMSQAYSINQSIQLQAQQAADARVTLANAAADAAKAVAAKEGDIVSSLKGSLDQLNNDIKTVGMGGMNNGVKAWVDKNAQTLQALGVKLPNQPNYFDLVHGIAGAMYNHDKLASQMYAPYGTGPGSTSGDYALKAYKLNANMEKLPTLAGDLTLQQVMQSAADPSRYVYNPAKGKLVETQQTGNVMVFDKQAGGPPTITPTFSGSVSKTIVLSPQMTAQMTKLHLQFSQNKDGTTGDGVAVQATAQTPAWLKDVIGTNGVTNVYSGQNGDLSFVSEGKTKLTAADKAAGITDPGGLSVYHIVKDAQGHQGIYYQGQNSEGFLKGEYGFNASMINQPGNQHQSLFGMIGNAAKAGIRDTASMFGHFGNGSNIVNQATSNYSLPPPIPIQQQVALPTISLPPPAPLPTVSVAPNVANTQPIVPRTVSIQGGSGTIQGTNVNPQSGGSGIKISGTTNAPVGIRI